MFIQIPQPDHKAQRSQYRPKRNGEGTQNPRDPPVAPQAYTFGRKRPRKIGNPWGLQGFSPGLFLAHLHSLVTFPYELKKVSNISMHGCVHRVITVLKSNERNSHKFSYRFSPILIFAFLLREILELVLMSRTQNQTI